MKRYINRFLILLVLIGIACILSTISVSSGNAYSIYIPIVSRSVSIELGTAASNFYVGDTRYNQMLAANFDRITPEVEGGYWWIYGRGNGWGWMDNIVKIAETNEQEILYHSLRWWWEEQPPNIEIWITEAMTRYPMITDWVVVNEGWGYCNQTIPLIDESFVIAREVRPDARLWYNGLLTDTCEQEQAIRLVQWRLADAIGIQMHLNLYSDINVFRPLLDWLQANNVAWAITELDVIVPVDNAYYRALQADIYGQVVELFLEYGGEFISMWGVSDAVSWQASNYPLPIDVNYLFKPAWYMLAGGE